MNEKQRANSSTGSLQPPPSPDPNTATQSPSSNVFPTSLPANYDSSVSSSNIDPNSSIFTSNTNTNTNPTSTINANTCFSSMASSQHYIDSQIEKIGHGHFFTKKSFHKPTYCHHCTEMLWGLIGQGYICEVCNFVCHEKCHKSVVSPCSSIAPNLIKNPVPHCWSEPGHYKRKFCNICRKRLEDALALRCEICEYYVHVDCQVLAVNDCCETATYVPNRDIKSIKHFHHWREGNLPTNSKCVVCKKTCWSAECLAGMKCEWCGITTHSICRMRLVDECNFGTLRDIIIPPHAVSVPRIEMNKKAILGIQYVKPKIRSSSNEWPSGGELKPETSSDPPSNAQVGQATTPTSSTSQSYMTFNSNTSSPNSLSTITGSNTGNTSFPNLNGLVPNQAPNGSSAAQFSASPPSPQFLPVNNGSSNTGNTSPSSPLPGSSGNSNSSSSQNMANNTPSSSNAAPQTATSNFGSGSGSSKKKDKNRPQLGDDEDVKETLKLYDGNATFRNQIYRPITVSRNSSYQSILETALRTFHINDDPTKYYLTIPIVSNSVLIDSYSNQDQNIQIDEKAVDENNPIKSIKSAATFNGGYGSYDSSRSVLLRYKDEERESIRIYPGMLDNRVSNYEKMKISYNTTVSETIKFVLEKFSYNKNASNEFCLAEVLLDHDANERILNPDDCPLQIVRQLRKDSLCNNRMMRFYLKQKEDPHGPSVALFVGNLPGGLSQIQYEKILMDTLKNNNDIKWTKFDAIYYEYGSMVILYDDGVKAVKAHRILKDSYYENKQLMVLLLPNIQPQMIPKNVCPLLVFVNVKSGGQQGAVLITSFRHLLNPHQVFDLQNGGPLPGLYVFRNIDSYRILACGGDGTIGWVLSCLDNVSQDARCQSPPMAIVPLGTGNDLARVLRWGTGYTGAEEPINLLKDVIDAEEISLDRWTVVFHQEENKEIDDMKRQLSISVNVGQANTNEDNTEIYVMNNYFGIGIDADVCLDFHTAREENPNKFNSRLNNKKYYLQMGIRKMMNKGLCRDFRNAVILEVDGIRIDLPPIEGIIILNILSWGSGANPWGSERDDNFQKATHYDGMLEVVGIKGVVHMGQIQSGISGAIRLAQGGRIKIKMNAEMPVQVDGEPWLQAPCAIVISKSALKATMLKKSKAKIRRRNTEPSVHDGVSGGPACNTRTETDPVDPDGDSEPPNFDTHKTTG